MSWWSGFLVAIVVVSGIEAGDQRPNIVIILADDLGYADVGFHGSDIQTPNLDALVADGVELDQYYVAPVCTPTRAGLLTGRYPVRFGMMRSVIPPHRDYGLDPSEDTLAEMLARAGYNHRAVFGKWHLGHNRKKWHPEEQGFAHFVGCLNGAFDYFTHERAGELDFHKNGEPYRVEGYATDILSDEAVSYIQSIPKDEPYFVYLPYNAPHSPFQAKDEDIAKYTHRKNKKKRIYAAMVDCMDQGIGRVLQAIEERGDMENTLLLFSSDNGGVKGVADNGPQRGNKFDPYNGGTRVVALMRWEKAGIVGGRKFRERIGYIDIMPTIKVAIGLNEDAVNPFDGVSFLDAIQGKAHFAERSWFTYLDQNAEAVQRLAVHTDDYKLVIHRPAPDGEVEQASIYEFFNMNADPTERRNVIDEVSDSLRSRYFSEVESFIRLIKPDQVERYQVGKEEFIAPKDWVIVD